MQFLIRRLRGRSKLFRLYRRRREPSAPCRACLGTFKTLDEAKAARTRQRELDAHAATTKEEDR